LANEKRVLLSNNIEYPTYPANMTFLGKEIFAGWAVSYNGHEAEGIPEYLARKFRRRETRYGNETASPFGNRSEGSSRTFEDSARIISGSPAQFVEQGVRLINNLPKKRVTNMPVSLVCD